MLRESTVTLAFLCSSFCTSSASSCALVVRSAVVLVPLASHTVSVVYGGKAVACLKDKNDCGGNTGSDSTPRQQRSSDSFDGKQALPILLVAALGV